MNGKGLSIDIEEIQRTAKEKSRGRNVRQKWEY
jgi:hypothetical protein